MVAILVEASLPQLYKQALMVVICESDETGRKAYHVLDIEGDGAVFNEVIARFFASWALVGDLPKSTIAVTPANYRFRFAGTVSTGESSAYIYKIRPKKGRPVPVDGEIWMDSSTGAELMLKGRVKGALTMQHADMVRETTVVNESVCQRVTHLSFVTPRLGPGQIVVTECPLQPGVEPAPPPNLSTSRNMLLGIRPTP